MTESSSPPATPAASGSQPPSDGTLVVTRSGGIAGFNDTVEIAADGTAQVTRKTGETSACTPSPEALDRLRAIDLAAVGSATSPIADGFTYSVRSATGSASAGDGDDKPGRAELVRAAADVVSSCLASQSETDAPDM